MQIKGRKMVCVFDSPTMISKISVVPRPNWGSRSNNLNITIFEVIPETYPPKIETFSGPYSVELEAVNGWNTITVDVSTLGLVRQCCTEAV